MRALVIGYGSIGARHARILTASGCLTSVVSRRKVSFPIVFGDLAEALESEVPEYVVIANETSKHQNTLAELAAHGYQGIVLIEKPIFDRYADIPENAFKDAFVAYNLRFHPIIQRIRALLREEQVLSVQVYVGQYLPDWRPDHDYRTGYSASADQGGGVLRDLSHELDYLCWLLGGWERVSAIGGHFSPLEISSDDIYMLLMAMRFCPAVTVQLNYLDRVGRRFLIINTARHTIEADLGKGTVKVDSNSETFSVERDQTYREMHEAVLSGKTDMLCTLEEGLEALRLVVASESAASKREWVNR